MVLKQLLPKSLSLPDVRHFNFDGLTIHMLKSYLATIPVADRIYGIECFISKDKLEPFFIAESHSVDLPIQQTESKLILREYGESNCSFLYSNKSSVFPFTMSESPIEGLHEIGTQMKDDELIILQVLAIKKQTEFWNDKLTDQYIDYINGVEYPTNNKIIRGIQHKIMEIQAKLEGGYRRNQRINEAEKKLKEDMFQTEVRFMVIAPNRDTRRKLARLVHSKFSKVDYVNSWLLSEDKDIHGYFEDVQLRRPSLSYPRQILCASELVNLLMISKHQPLEVVTPIIEPAAPPIPAAIESPVSEEDKSNPFALFPRGSKLVRENDVNFASNLNNALKKLSLTTADVVVQKFQHGATTQKITFSLPAGLKLSDLTKSTQNIQVELGMNSISFEQGDVAGTANIIIPQEDREMVFVRDCSESLAFQEKTKKYELPIFFGVDTAGEIVMTCLTMIKHLLIAGTTGSGKSYFLNTLLVVLFSLVSPDMLKVYMLDPKKVELSGYRSFPHVQNVYTEMNEAEGVLFFLCAKMEERYSLFEQKGYKNIQQYNKHEKVKLPYLLLVIDELADLMSTNSEVEEYLVRLAQKARAAGIHLIIATQYPIREVVTPLIKRNIYSRVCLMLDSSTAYRVVLDEAPKYTLLGKGDGMYRLEGIQGIHRFQGAVIGKDDDEQEKAIERLSSFWKSDNKKEVIDLEAARNKKRNDETKAFRKVVLETGETRISELPKVLEMRTEKVKAYMDELVILGWVKKHSARSKGYELLLSPEQRKVELEKLK
ncbi:FtsK/SpoIIIE domain-containing protein [Paenibacillus cremeus]|nr:FtsK/SpoIIIE domain-containing protein [Paenibacillus cremeus]